MKRCAVLLFFFLCFYTCSGGRSSRAKERLIKKATDVDVGLLHSCAIVQNIESICEGEVCSEHLFGRVYCWGSNIVGQVGNGLDSAGQEVPPRAALIDLGSGLDNSAVQISTGQDFTCVLLDSGRVKCWGENAAGQLGVGHTKPLGMTKIPLISEIPYVPLGGPARKICTGRRHACAIMDSGKLRCWGEGTNGQLGYKILENVGETLELKPRDAGNVPLRIQEESVVDVSCGNIHTCAVTKSGKVKCWGTNQFGQLGSGKITDVLAHPNQLPVVELGPDVAVQNVSCGWGHTCVLTTTGSVICWGLNDLAQLGSGDMLEMPRTAHPATRKPVDLNREKAVQLDAGNFHTCALTDVGNVYCWGFNFAGQCGYLTQHPVGGDTPVGANGPVLVGDGVKKVSAGIVTTCVVTIRGTIRCWGGGQHGQLGFGKDTVEIGVTQPPAHYGDITVLPDVGIPPAPHQMPPVSMEILYSYKKRMENRIGIPVESLKYDFDVTVHNQ